MNARLARLEVQTRAAHAARWGAFWEKLRTTLDDLPRGALERFEPVEIDDLDDLEDALRLWEGWADRVLPLLEQADDLSVWPHDLPPAPGDPAPLLLTVLSRWRKHPNRPWGALLVLLALGVAVGEGG
jgi:hypothetical protein